MIHFHALIGVLSPDFIGLIFEYLSFVFCHIWLNDLVIFLFLLNVCLIEFTLQDSLVNAMVLNLKGLFLTNTFHDLHTPRINKQKKNLDNNKVLQQLVQQMFQ